MSKDLKWEKRLSYTYVDERFHIEISQRGRSSFAPRLLWKYDLYTALALTPVCFGFGRTLAEVKKLAIKAKNEREKLK